MKTNKLQKLAEGKSVFVQGSGKNPYEIKKVGGVVSCDCMGWKTCRGSLDQKTCKHIRNNIDPSCLLPQARKAVAKIAKAPKPVRLTKTGKVSTAVGGVVVKPTAPPVLLAHKLTDKDPKGMWISEKLDGCRAWWNGTDFISRLGNTYHAPAWFKALLPKGVVLDGELWIGRGMFQKTISAVRKLVADNKEWKQVKYVIYDAPKFNGNFEKRMEYLGTLFEIHSAGNTNKQVFVLEQVKCRGTNDLKSYLQKCEEKGGEGVMLREAGSMYVEGRSNTLLKVKSFHDAEAIVISHVAGRGKHKGRLGAIMVRRPDGKEFKIGTGFSDEERKNPPPVGSTITYSYTELTTGENVPKCAAFVCVRSYE